MRKSYPNGHQVPKNQSTKGATAMNMGRRTFLKAGVAGAATLFVPDWIAADPYGPYLRPLSGSPIRIRGQVRSGGGGIGGVSISDGLTVAQTRRDGSFEIVTTDDRDFLRLSVPAGFRIPQNQTGTARFYRPIVSSGSGEMEAVFELEPLAASDDNHALFLLADIQAEDAHELALFREQTVPDIQATVRALGNPEAMGIADGDIMYDHLELFSEYERAVAGAGIPFFQVLGNHDQNQDRPTDEGSTDTFNQHFGPRYYSFDRGAVHYVVLDDVFWFGTGYMGYLGADQLRWLKNDLRFVEAGRPVILAAHIPILG
ncbi:MAG: metallophosphoesterase N-terminal domain-containing protein, partial [Gemmatimonadota bacterium]